MNTFLEDKISLPTKNTLHSISYSHQKDKLLLAVNIQLDFVFETSNEISKVFWHPQINILVIGQTNGQIKLCYIQEEDIISLEDIHRCEINEIFYSRCGELMITCDSDLKMVFWIGQNPIKMEQRYAPITKMLFVDFQYEKLEGQFKTVKLVFLGDKMGNIEYFEEKKLVLKELSKMNGSIRELFFFERNNTIVVITSTYYLFQFMISTKEDIVLDKKMKITMPSTADKLTGLCLLPNSFLLNTKENTLKIWNVVKDINYGLSLYDFVQDGKEKKKLYVTHVQFDPIDVILYICMSNEEILVLQGKINEIGEDSNDWKKIAVIKTGMKGKHLKQIEIEKQNNLVLRYETEILIYRRSKVKVFVEPLKQLTFIQKGLNQIECQDGLGGNQSNFNFHSKIKDFLIYENSIIVLDTEKTIYNLNIQEVMNYNTKLKPILNKFGSSSDIQNLKQQGIPVEQGIKKVILTKNGFCGILNQKKMMFYNFKNEPLMTYRVSKRDESFIDIVLNSHMDIFALITNDFQMKVFQTNPKNIKIIYENLNLYEEIKNVEKFSLNTQKLSKISSYEILGIQQESNDEIRKSFVKKKVKLEKIIINQNGQVVLLISNQFNFNIVLKNLISEKNFVFNIGEPFLIQDANFDSLDSRFIVLQAINEEGQRYLITLCCDNETLKFFDKVKLDEDEYLIHSVFPLFYISGYDENNQIEIKEKYPSIFNQLLSNNKKSLLLKEFCQDFAYNLSFEQLQKCIESLKKIEIDFDLNDFWDTVLKIALKNKNLAITEFCLGMTKNYQLHNLIETLITSQPNTVSDQQKLAIIALAFNNIDLAKEILFQEGQYYQIAELLFMEQNFKILIEFCQQYLKTHINYYYFKIAFVYEEKKDYLKFIKFYKKSKVPQYQMFQRLIQIGQINWLKKYLNSNNCFEGNFLLFKHYWKSYQNELAIQYLQKNKENECYLLDHKLQQNIDVEKCLSQLKQVKLTSQNLLIKNQALQKISEQKNFIDTVELMLKEKSYKKLIIYLQEKDNELQQHDDLLSKIVDIIYNYYCTNFSFSILSIADYLMKKNFKERSIQLYVKAKQHQKAYFYAKKFNFSHLLSQIEQDFKENNSLKSQKKQEQQLDRKEKKSLLVKRDTHDVMDILDSQNWQELKLKLENDQISVSWNFFEKIKEQDFPEKKEILENIAKKWFKQGDFDMAVKAYLDLKNNIKVMKTLIKQKNIGKIISIANYTRDEQVYELAANFLQTCKIQYNDNIYRSIISFYSKCKNYQALINFLKGFSHQEITNKRFKETENVLQKIKDISLKIKDNQQIIEDCDQNLNYVKKIKKIEEMIKNNESVEVLREIEQTQINFNKQNQSFNKIRNERINLTINK